MPKLKHIMFSRLYIDRLLKGEKSLTIRAKRPNLKPGDLALVHSLGMIVGKVRVLSVQAKRLKDISEEEAVQDGFESVDQLKAALKKHYPHLREDSYVYVVRFEWMERYDPPLAEEHFWPYAFTPAEVAQLALSSGIELSEEDREILGLLAKEKSIRRAAVKLGGLSLRSLVRGVVRRVALELERRGLLKRVSPS
uniref:ASCH domain-containing protein n=1 Tax=Thermofilum pendens TaxID=2269 RepID=A0A7C4BA97_THEPE